MKSFLSLMTLFVILQISYALSNLSYCYWGSWSGDRPGNGKFTTDDIDASLCTHIAYSFFGADSSGNVVISDDGSNIPKFIALRDQNPNLKLMAAIGGWSQSSADLSKIANDPGLRATFVQNVVNFLGQHNFNGMDLDWEYPAQRGGAPSDHEAYIQLLQDLKAAFQPHGYILVAVVGASDIDTSYNVPAMTQIVDFINVMTYDFHGTWEGVTGVNAPLYSQKTDPPGSQSNVDSAIHNWINHGASPDKLLLGLGTYGHTFTLADQNNAGTGAPTTGAGAAGPYSGAGEQWSYLEICESQKSDPGDWHITNVDNSYVYGNKGDFWVGYDDKDTMHAKGAYAKNLGLAGVMFWAIDMDDFHGECGEKNSLMHAAINGYNGN